MLRITDTLFPSHAPFEAQIYQVGEEVPPFTIEEVDRVVHRAKWKANAPSLDNITGRILSTVRGLCPSMLIGL